MTHAGPLSPLVIASAFALLCGSLAARIALRKHPRWRFVSQAAVFICLSVLLWTNHIVPFQAMTNIAADSARRLAVAGVEIAWWLMGASLLRKMLRAFLELRSKQRDAILAQEVLGALIYLIAVIAILTYVFDLPVKGLLATSGAFAIIVGLALQSSLGDAFSGIVLDLERPYRVGDWIVVDGAVQGVVVETNWRTTHIHTASNDLAIVPNSVIAKSRIINCSQPTQAHTSSVSVRLTRALVLETGTDLMKDVLMGCTRVVHAGEPSVKVKDVTSESIEYELGFSVLDVTLVDEAKADLLQRALYAATVAGANFAPRSSAAVPCDRPGSAGHHRLLEAIPLFEPLTEDERARLLEKMRRRSYPAGSVVATRGTVMESLVIVSRGVLTAWEGDGSTAVESARWSPGFYFGEMGLLTGEPQSGDVTALTQTVTYEIRKDDLAPILRARPEVADHLGETLALRECARQRSLGQRRAPASQPLTIAARIADTIRQLFGLR
jgi:small-conductance mechanosensitive channel/CRP-like cAMP-binding protein